MKISFYLTVLAIAVMSVSAQTNENIKEYVQLSQNQFRHPFFIWQVEIDSIATRGDDLLKSFDYRQELIIQKIESIERSLDLLEILGATRKQCVQKYRPVLLNSYNTRSKLTTCRTTLLNRLTYLTYTPQNALMDAELAIDVNLPAKIATCNETELEDCVIKNVETYTAQGAEILEVVAADIEVSICRLSDYRRESTTCAFKVEQEALIVAGSVLLSIERCLEQSENSCSCNEVKEKSLVETEPFRSLIEGE